MGFGTAAEGCGTGCGTGFGNPAFIIFLILVLLVCGCGFFI